MSIPKIIHYCWFGGNEMPKCAKKCIESWKKHCPDYEIICWNETNSLIKNNRYASQAYEVGQWAFVSDYVRLKALYEYGGIYLDTDVELLNPLDSFLHLSAFIGFEAEDQLGTAVIGAQKGSAWIKEIMDSYEGRAFFLGNGQDTRTNVEWITSYMIENYALKLDGSKQTWEGILTVYPTSVFSPKDYRTGTIHICSETVTIHHYMGSWLSLKQKLRHKVYIAVSSLVGECIARQVKAMVRGKEDTK